MLVQARIGQCFLSLRNFCVIDLYWRAAEHIRNIARGHNRWEFPKPLSYYYPQVPLDFSFRRYNCERLCNRLGRVKRFHNWREPIPEGYFPKLDSLVASRTWPARPAGAILKDINRPVDQLNFDLQDLERWRDRIYEAIHTGSIINPRGERVPLTEFGGVDVLGNIMEASILSANPNVYGDLHNLGHVAISYCHDPDHRYLVMLRACDHRRNALTFGENSLIPLTSALTVNVSTLRGY